MRKAVSAAERSKGKVYTFKAPVRGLVTNEQVSDAKPGAAAILQNWFPLKYSVRLRGGLDLTATIGSGGAFQEDAFQADAFALSDGSHEDVKAFMAYRAQGVETLFASDPLHVFDVTPPLGDTGTIPTPVLTGQTNGDWSHVNFATSGGNFLVMVNGADTRQLYDGSVWATTPAMTGGSGTNGNNHSCVWEHKSRLYFVVSGTLKVEYLPVDSIGGALGTINLGSVFHRGGAIVFGETWSIDAGDGLDDVWLVVTDQGEMAVYQGSNPGDASAWGLVGRYEVGIPLGRDAIMRAGGDLMVCTTDGFVSVQSATRKDQVALTLTAVSFPIEPDWRTYAANRRGRSWKVTRWNEKGLAVISFPNDTGQDVECLVLNLQTGAWTKYTGWDITASIEFQEQLYIGTTDGLVCAAEVTGTDMGVPYYGAYLGLHEPIGDIAQEKAALMMRGTFRHRSAFQANIGVSTDYERVLGSYPNAPAEPEGSIWDVSLWDIDVWDAGIAETVTTGWASTSGNGFAMGPIVQVTSGTTAFPNIEIISVDLLYEPGGVVV